MAASGFVVIASGLIVIAFANGPLARSTGATRGRHVLETPTMATPYTQPMSHHRFKPRQTARLGLSFEPLACPICMKHCGSAGYRKVVAPDPNPRPMPPRPQRE